MPRVTVSSKYQIEIPREIRERLHLRPGQEMGVFVHDGRVELVPLRPLRELRGVLSGAPLFEREPDRPS